MMLPPKVMRSTMAAQSLGSVQMGRARARVTDQAERVTLADPFAGGEGVDGRGVDVGMRVVVEGPQRLLAREPGGLDAPLLWWKTRSTSGSGRDEMTEGGCRS
jgi:hypothetical protein